MSLPPEVRHLIKLVSQLVTEDVFFPNNTCVTEVIRNREEGTCEAEKVVALSAWSVFRTSLWHGTPHGVLLKPGRELSEPAPSSSEHPASHLRPLAPSVAGIPPNFCCTFSQKAHP